MPALGTISTIKETVVTYQSLLLCVFTFSDGTKLRLSTHGLNSAEGGAVPSISGFPEDGQSFFSRIESQDLAAIQAMSQEGIDLPPNHTAHLADADKFLWANYEITKGFKGATLTVYLAFWEPGTSNFSTDYHTKFIGICSSPQNITARGMSISATNKLNMGKTLFPIFPIQKRCAHDYPATAAQRQDGADNPDSQFFGCGYSPDATGSNARGNGLFPTCDRSKAACVTRGMYTQDSSSRKTGRFSGVQWDPPATWRSKSYTEGKSIDGLNTSNDQKYRQYVPMAYGTCFVDPVISNWQGEGNSSRGEMIITSGYVQSVIKVIVNDVLIPDNNAPYRAPDQLFRWQWINTGTRTGGPNLDAGFDGLGDPYGSMAVIEVVVPRKLADSGSVPRARILLQGPRIRVYTDASTYTEVYSANPVWVLLDLMVRGPWRYSDFDLASFVTAAAACDSSISYIDLSGNPNSHARYSCSLPITQRRSLAEIVRGVRMSCKAMLVPAATGAGLLQIFIKQTLADQQPAPISGSNYNAAISSKTAAGVVANGYVAYDFNASSIEEGTLVFSTRSIGESANVRTGTFQDSENEYTFDSYRLADSVDIARAGQEVSASLPLDGANTYDQLLRVNETDSAETYRGNMRGDSGCTYQVEFSSSVKVVHLKAGQIVRFSDIQHGISNQLFRVMKLQPSNSNMERTKVTLQWHEDNWYLDTYGQGQEPVYSSSGKQRLGRPPFGWQPNAAFPRATDPIVNPDESNFAVAQVYDTAADGTAIAKLQISGVLPVNTLSSLGGPLIGQQGTTANTGGVILGGRVIYAVVTAVDSDGKQSAPSSVMCVIAVPAATNTNTVTIPVVAWHPDAVGWNVYAGPNPNTLTFQASGVGTPGSITLGSTALSVRSYSQPDVMFDHFEVRAKRVIHSGVFGAAISAVTATTLRFLGATFTTNQWAGYDLTILGRAGESSDLPIDNIRIASNTADTLTVVGGTPDLVATMLLEVGDVAVMRTKPNTFTAATVGDSNFVNSFGPSGLTAGAEVGMILRIIEGLGRGQTRKIIANTSTVLTVDRDFDTTPDATSRFIVEEPSWQINTPTSHVQNSDSAGMIYQTANVDNFKGTVLLAQVLTNDSEGNDCFEQDAPLREIYLFGLPPGTRLVLADTTVLFSDQTILVDSTGGPVTVQLLPAGTFQGRPLDIKRVNGGSNAVTILPDGSETIDGAASVVLSNQYDSLSLTSA